ncbi:small acid-soluble spore protein SspI [Xylanibacillus composti]|uniref:Small, acid-soluble spore protein I n=1 Tax=Xylanibacillus composti TaxID=1572762 RepID=A0A8J4H2F6_9BACL|nr:small acid-soluble spore protein SspI [Xylanibacillus composti]MDT9723567.1 small acid-soluble spore protein SspI [Xylanibacillus composti]GIQ68395.1 small, acid-soluble spore protein I [Xylanibacillus composti]
MNLDLRQAIVQRVQDKDNAELMEVVQSSIDNDERTLPGLGVLFEIIWKNTDENVHEQLITSLRSGLTP